MGYYSLKERSENASSSAMLKQKLVESMFPLSWWGPWIRPCMSHMLTTGRFFPSFHEQYHSYISKLLVTCWAVCLLTQMKRHSPVWWAAQFNLLCSMSTWLLASYQGGLQVNKIWRWNVARAVVLHKQCPPAWDWMLSEELRCIWWNTIIRCCCLIRLSGKGEILVRKISLK